MFQQIDCEWETQCFRIQRFFPKLSTCFDAINKYETNAAVYISQPRFLRFPAFDPIFNGNPWCVCYNELFVCQIEVLPNCMKKVLDKMQFTVSGGKKGLLLLSIVVFSLEKMGVSLCQSCHLVSTKEFLKCVNHCVKLGLCKMVLVSGSAKTPCCWVTKKLSYEKSWVVAVWRNIFTAIGKSLPPSLHIQHFISEWLAWRIWN